MSRYRLLALDLDGTLLDSRKVLTEKTYDALKRAADAGVVIVPSTGRIYNCVPGIIMDMPFVDYMIGINGAEIKHRVTGEAIFTCEMTPEKAVEVLNYCRRPDAVAYAYVNDGCFIDFPSEDIFAYTNDTGYTDILRKIAVRVPDLCEHLLKIHEPVAKIVCMTLNSELRADFLKNLEKDVEGTQVTSAMSCNVEINAKGANKGTAIIELGKKLGISREEMAAAGDGINDIPMIEAAGLGAAMENAMDAVKRAADVVTLSNDEDGVAYLIDNYILK